MTDPITVIGTKTMINGNLEGDEDLTVEGHVEGSINLSKTLTVEVGGVVRANINVRNAIISGVLVGNVEAQEAVHVTEQGRVVGDPSQRVGIHARGRRGRGGGPFANCSHTRSHGPDPSSGRASRAFSFVARACQGNREENTYQEEEEATGSQGSLGG